jgi:hypothetical protein
VAIRVVFFERKRKKFAIISRANQLQEKDY